MRDTIIDHDGQLAIDSGWTPDWNKPEEYRILYIGRARADDWRDLIGAPVTYTGNTGTVRSGGRPYRLQTDDAREWTREVQTRPIPKPRKGKRYDWQYGSGHWYKVSR